MLREEVYQHFPTHFISGVLRVAETSMSDFRPIAFVHGRLITGCDDKPVEPAVVIVEGSKITAAGHSDETTVPDNSLIIDITGKTILPGLIDTHVHVGNIAVDMLETARLTPAVYVHLASRNLETDLGLGFTTLRDAGGLDSSFREAIKQGLIIGPRLLLSVNPLTPTGGHFDERGPFENDPQPRNSLGIYPEICDGPEEVRRAARQVLRRGADHVKVAAGGGISSPSDEPDQWQFNLEELRAAVETAEAAGTYVMAHAYNPAAIKNCIDAGVRSIEHGNLIDRQTAKLMAESGIFYVPTMTVYDVLAKEAAHLMNGATARKLELVYDKALVALQNCVSEGVKIGSGSDIIGPFQYLKGREFALKAQVMSSMEAIRSATLTNAEMLGMAEQIGSIETGKEADMIVVDGNPLNDLSLFENGLERVVLVMKEGIIYKDTLKLSPEST